MTFFFSFALTCLKMGTLSLAKKKKEEKKGILDYLNELAFIFLCSATHNALWVLMKRVPFFNSLYFLFSFHLSGVSLFGCFSKMLCRLKHNKCLALSVRGYFHITETINNNQSIHHALLVA